MILYGFFGNKLNKLIISVEKVNRNKNGVTENVDIKPGGACWHQLIRLGCLWEIVQYKYICISKVFFFVFDRKWMTDRFLTLKDLITKSGF
jgi:hypothetical protein